MSKVFEYFDHCFVCRSVDRLLKLSLAMSAWNISIWFQATYTTPDLNIFAVLRATIRYILAIRESRDSTIILPTPNGLAMWWLAIWWMATALEGFWTEMQRKKATVLFSAASLKPIFIASWTRKTFGATVCMAMGQCYGPPLNLAFVYEAEDYWCFDENVIKWRPLVHVIWNHSRILTR